MGTAKSRSCTKSRKKGVFLVIVLVISITSACVGFYILKRSPAAEPTLRFVSIIHRHGERSAERSYPLDPYKGESFWPEGPGALTKRGKVGLHKLGVSFRQRYDGFLSAKYSPSQIRIQSSDYDRCLMSASLVLAGLYPPIGVQLWNPDLQWQPIPVHSAPLQCDDQEQGLPLPEWAQGGVYEKLQALSDIYNLYKNVSPTMFKLLTGVLINEIVSNMKRKASITENFELRASLYSGHDDTIVGLWGGLNITSEITERPPYGAALIIELHEIDGKYRVKILYKRSYLDETLEVLKIQGCKDGKGIGQDDTCDLDLFSNALRPAIIENFENECKIL
ncbi:lysosomal acid phosphatase isoform X2 [Bemisia tabaci]|uniref:lysosomal acid phosphatase isoform X2 n=1 Tax=Bemisia tabaci TaxID=7038 RepID=UPI003B2849A9